MLKKYLMDIGIAIVAVFAPIHAVLATVGVLIVADLILGIWAAKRRGEAITSKAMSRSVLKCLIYELAVMMGFLVETYLMDGWMPVTKIVGSLIGMVELKSLLENCGDILGQPIFQVIVSKLQRQAEDTLQTSLPSSDSSKSDQDK